MFYFHQYEFGFVLVYQNDTLDVTYKDTTKFDLQNVIVEGQDDPAEAVEVTVKPGETKVIKLCYNFAGEPVFKGMKQKHEVIVGGLM